MVKMFNLFKKGVAPVANEKWFRRWSMTGVEMSAANSTGGVKLGGELVRGYLTQLVDDGLAVETGDGAVLPWDSLYLALSNPAYAGLVDALRIPDLVNAKPALRSRQSLADKDFSIAIGEWRNQAGKPFDGELIGPILVDGDSTGLMLPAQWELFKAAVAFAKRPSEEHSDLAHRKAWGAIRKLALSADAILDDFLHRSVVLTPETLDIELRKSAVVADDKVVEVIPGFADEPLGWLEAFDRAKEVRDRYDIPTAEGIVQVLIAPKVRTVLQEIKRMEHRRVAGARARAFLVNPFATLGPDATDVISEKQFESARDDAGLTYERFIPVVERDGLGRPEKVGLMIEVSNSSGILSSESRWLNVDELKSFVQTLSVSLEKGHQLLAWHGYDFELSGEASRHLEVLCDVLGIWQSSTTLVSYAQVHDLSGYSARIEGIGAEKPYHSPFIAKKNEGEGWFPENVVPMVVYQPKDGSEPIAVPTSKAAIEKLKEDIDVAIGTGKQSVEVPWLPESISVEDGNAIVKAFGRLFDELEAEGASGQTGSKGTGGKRSLDVPAQLILRANIQKVEYEELRREALESLPRAPKIPVSIRPEYSLLPHQCEGLAWLQHLFSLQTDYQVRGAILADDMGLGKTFQLLALIAGLLEREPDIAPMLVVAPVSLLENWAEEAQKFFVPGALPVLTAYGKGLDSLRVQRSQIDERLLEEDKLVKFLVPNWVGTAKIVLTTYETLRDLEFSFAAQKWSLMVCDEAQRIKNPAAMVTRAAKKQNVDFKIACTGTPVENTLADLWCLFDFVQPGLLGALTEFGDRYRKPIEASTAEEKSRVEELRARISPQILRRLKIDVATDLPPKIIVNDCRRLPISTEQRNLYSKSVESFKKRAEPGNVSPFKNHLGLLHYLRLVCTDPRPHGLNVFKPEVLREYREKAPKLHWLLNVLRDIKAKGEKAIVFCEFREIQRLLQHYIEEEFLLQPDIINGDTSASAAHTASRQKRIKAFQEKDGFGVIVLSPIAVGFGVNIQKANHVIHYTRTWNPAKEDQATDRAYRIGQKKPVYVYYPVVHAHDFTTFDIKLDELLEYKRKLAEDMLNGSGDITPGDFKIVDVVPGASVDDIDKRIDIDLASRMGWQHFECLAAALWTKLGYECYRTPATKDYGVDVVAILGQSGLLIQTKTSGTDGHALNWDAVKEVVAGEAYYQRRHPKVQFKKICLTNQFFNKHASENAELNSVQLLDRNELNILLDGHQVMMLEVERMLYAEWTSQYE
jgi:hypothetical protein